MAGRGPSGHLTSTLSSRILIEAGVGLTKGLFPCTPENVTDIFDFVVKPTDIHHVEASTGLQYNAKSSYAARNDQDRFGQRFALSYVTGSHAFKTGFQVQEHVKDNSRKSIRVLITASITGCRIGFPSMRPRIC